MGNVYIPMDLENDIIREVQMFIDEEQETKQTIMDAANRARAELEGKKKQIENEQRDKVDTFMSFTSMTDRAKARKLLEANDWDLEKATANQFASSPDLFKHEQNNNHNSHNHVQPGSHVGGNVHGSQKTVIRIILPGNETYTFQMDAHDTFWSVYGRLVQSVPELVNKPGFTLEITGGNGMHTSVLNEPEFNQTLIEKGM